MQQNKNFVHDHLLFNKKELGSRKGWQRNYSNTFIINKFYDNSSPTNRKITASILDCNHSRVQIVFLTNNKKS